MVQFRYLYAVSSDGQLKIKTTNNGPTRDQQQQQWRIGKDGKRSMDYYRQLTHADGKYVDWLQKLGCMAARELIRAEWDAVAVDAQKSFLLYDFPAGFTLWEHVKKSESVEDGAASATAAATAAAAAAAASTAKTTKTKSHAAGGHDRMDAYLYGHPHGKKRYRSPGEFFPHLLWLLTDETKDHDKCRCVCCCPDVLQPAALRPGAVKAEKKNIASDPQIKSPTPKAAIPTKSANVAVVVPVSRPSAVAATPNQGVAVAGGMPDHRNASQIEHHAQAGSAQQHQPSYQSQHMQQQQYQQRVPIENIQASSTAPADPRDNQGVYDQYAAAQYGQYPSRGQEEPMFEMPAHNADQIDYTTTDSYQQFSNMGYDGQQFNYASLPGDQQYGQYHLQHSQNQPQFSDGVDPNLGYVNDMHQWTNMSGQYGHDSGPSNNH